jgi:PqqD family protein of HPr-rel-A system
MPGPVWHCRTPIQDVLLAWEGEQHAVFFDPVTGDTHLIAALGAQLAEWLAAEPLDHDQLLHRLAHDVDWDEPPSAEALNEMLHLHMGRLAEVHLLAQAPAAPPSATRDPLEEPSA